MSQATVIKVNNSHGMPKGSMRFEDGNIYYYDEFNRCIGSEFLPGQVLAPDGSNLTSKQNSKILNIKKMFRGRL